MRQLHALERRTWPSVLRRLRILAEISPEPNGSSQFPSFFQLHCYACRSLHDVCQFSSNYQQSLRRQPERRCLDQQGSVQLCAHIQMTWAKIKVHTDDWRQEHPGRGDWQACLDSFEIECHVASHDTRYTALESLTWLRAHLNTSKFDSDIVLLNLEWIPHSRIDALALAVDGRTPASELRALFQSLRRLGPADNLCPTPHRGALPEMAFFGPLYRTVRFGDSVYYKTGEDIGPLPASIPRLTSDSSFVWYHSYGRGKNGIHKKLAISLNYSRDAIGTTISSAMSGDQLRERHNDLQNNSHDTHPAVKLIPTDHWLHAMDT
jgi:hypothetical protein